MHHLHNLMVMWMQRMNISCLWLYVQELWKTKSGEQNMILLRRAKRQLNSILDLSMDVWDSSFEAYEIINYKVYRTLFTIDTNYMVLWMERVNISWFWLYVQELRKIKAGTDVAFTLWISLLSHTYPSTVGTVLSKHIKS